jgi:hypothetical protein
VEFKDISKPLAEVAQQYHFHKPPPFIEQLREAAIKFFRWLNEMWREMFRQSAGNLDSRSISTFFQWLIVFCAVVAIVGAVFVLMRRIKKQQQEAQQTIRGAQAVEEILDAGGWRDKAVKLAAQADYRGACRALYLSVLKNFDENGVAEFAPTKTNYEYSYALAKQPALQQGFKRLAYLVELVWFGNKQADENDYAESMSCLDDLQQQVQAAAAAAGKATSSENAAP